MKIEINLPEITKEKWIEHSEDIIDRVFTKLKSITPPNQPILPIPEEELRINLGFKLGGKISTSGDGNPPVTEVSGGLVITF